MAAISGLQSPNPYAQPATRTTTRTPSASFSNNLANQAIPSHPSYNPDWMQAEHVSATPAANDAGNKVTDTVTLSTDYAALRGKTSPE